MGSGSVDPCLTFPLARHPFPQGVKSSSPTPTGWLPCVALIPLFLPSCSWKPRSDPGLQPIPTPGDPGSPRALQGTCWETHSFYKENKCLYFPSKKQEVATGGRDRRYLMSSKCFPSGNILEVSSALFSSCPGQFCKAVLIFREGKTRPGRSRGKSGLGPGLLVNSRAPSPLCTQVSMNPAPNRALVGPSRLWAPRALHTAMPSGVTGQGHQRS